MMSDEMCPTPAGGVVLNDVGKCPCDKELKDCCHHKDDAMENTNNAALEELCVPTNGDMSPCGDEVVSEKTA
jgi:hypothetical protein